MRLQYSMYRTFLLIGLLALNGCTSIMVLTGFRVRLEKIEIKSIQARLAERDAMYPGQKASLVVSVTKPDGQVLLTEGAANGKVLWEDLRIESTLASVDAEGNVSLPADPLLSEGKTPYLLVSVPSHPGISTKLNILLRYDGDYVADFSGARGIDGVDGIDGRSGEAGTDGSTDKDNPSPGGNGGNGENGGNGGDGGRGFDALPVLVQVSMRKSTYPLLQVSVSNINKIERFLVDPHGGTLMIKAYGGPGGRGGRGGSGGAGGAGGKGIPEGKPGSSGQSGSDGNDGPPGHPGTISVIFDPKAQPYLQLQMLTFFNGYNYGKQPGPPPVFQAKPLDTLW